MSVKSENYKVKIQVVHVQKERSTSVHDENDLQSGNVLCPVLKRFDDLMKTTKEL